MSLPIVIVQHAVALFWMLLLSGIAQAESQQIIPVGTFTNFRFTEEHQYGAGVQLWREGGSLFGIFSFAQGLNGDTPTGVLEKVSFDPKTGRVAFTARLTLGMHSCKVHTNLPSQDIFIIEGMLSDHSLSGTMKRTDNLHQDLTPTAEKIDLVRSDDWFVTDFRNREQWQVAMNDILTRRGPKW
jgi:hypothetical protein